MNKTLFSSVFHSRSLHTHRAPSRRPWQSHSPNKETINHVCERLSKCLLSGKQQGSGIYLAQGNAAIRAASQAVSQSFRQPASESDIQNPMQACNSHLLWGARRLFADNSTAKQIQKHRHMHRMYTGMPKGCINRCVPVHTNARTGMHCRAYVEKE